MRYTNGGYIGSGYSPQTSGDVDGIWRYYTDICRAIRQNQWYVSTIPTNVVVDPDVVADTEGSEITLTASYDQDPQGYNETFQWQTSSDNSTWVDIFGETNNTLVFTLSASDDGTYRRYRIYRGFKNAVSASASITIANYTITISDQPDNTTKYAGEQASFTVAASVDTDPISIPNYQWQVSTDNGSSWANAPGTSTNATYNFYTTYTQNGYQYRCYLTAAGAEPLTSDTATLTVNQNTITIYTQPSDGYCSCSDPVVFSVYASISNMASLSYEWYKSSTEDGEYSVITGSDAGFTNYTTSSLSIDCGEQTNSLYVKCRVYYNTVEIFSDSALYDTVTTPCPGYY